VGKGQLKERCGLEPQTNFFPFNKLPKTECRLDSVADYIREYMVFNAEGFPAVQPIYALYCIVLMGQ
jgi:hypothetical protein